MASARRIGRWAPVVAWAAWIFVASTSAFSEAHTGSIIVPILAWTFPHADVRTLERMHMAIRKSAHFVEYLVLAWLVARALREGGPWRLRHAVLAVLFATAYACSDEWHQRYVPERTSALRDVAIDAAGAITGQVAAAARRLLLR